MVKYFKGIWDSVYTALVGMGITWNHLFAKKVTQQYPEKWHPIKSGEMPPNSRNRLFLDIDDCNGCTGCARACPVNCIDIETVKVTPDDDAPPLKSGGKRGLWVTHYEIDMAKCCFCSLCTEACPTNAIVMTPEFEYSAYDREDLKYKFSIMNEEEVIEKKKLYEEFQEEQKKKKAAAAAAKKAEEAKKAAEGDGKADGIDAAKVPVAKKAEIKNAAEGDGKAEAKPEPKSPESKNDEEKTEEDK